MDNKEQAKREWRLIEFRRLRNKMFKGTASEKEEKKFHELRKELGINWEINSN